MLEKQLLGTRYVADVNVLAIYLVSNHPGFQYVKDLLDEAISAEVKLLVFDFLPLRVYWILTSKWRVDKKDAKKSVLSLLSLYNIELISLRKEDISKAFNLAAKLKHDVYDTIYIVLALREKAEGIITTDRDFEKLAKAIGIEYVNPVPDTVLKKFASFK
ncbi:MAG: type II toxin-antitoxin system VapC family toxin [Candidatus Njordarchaeia archaeon]